MGNTVPPRMCQKEAAAATPAGRRRRPKNVVADADDSEAAAPYYAAAPRRAPVTPRKLQRAGCVSWAGGAGADGDGAAAGKAAPVATVKIVLRRKDAEALVARLNAQSARERKARMAEIKGELRAGECGTGAGASPASCRDAWKPRLAPITEN